MHIVIDLPEEMIYRFKNEGEQRHYDYHTVLTACVNGTPLPKGHGVLKDVDKIISDGRSKGFCDWYDEMQYAETVVEADPAQATIEESKDTEYDIGGE